MKCIVCEKIVPENKRVYQGTDWCEDCVKKEGQRFTKFHSTDVPFFYSAYPYYVTYRKLIPNKIRLEVLNFKE